MDSVRFGRVLGIGARHAARTLLHAADAAAAPNPRPISAPPSATAPSPRAGNAPVRTSGVAEGSRRFGRAVLSPAARAGRVLWLEFTGTFFGIFALLAGIGAWRLRSAWPTNAPQHRQLLVTLIVAALFTWFCASSFRQAAARSRRP